MNFGNDIHPKWNEKEEMTLIFLAAANEWDADDIRTEINALFGNERSEESVALRVKKNKRAIESLSSLLAANPVMVAHFWKRQGVVESLPVIEAVPKKDSLYNRIRSLVPLATEDMSEDAFVTAFSLYLKEEQSKATQAAEALALERKRNSPMLSVSRLTKDEVTFTHESDATLDQIQELIRTLKKE